MIVVSILGGIGNQLFQYAFAKAMERRLNRTVYLLDRVNNSAYKRQWALSRFDISLPLISSTRVRRLSNSKRSFLFWRRYAGKRLTTIVCNELLPIKLVPAHKGEGFWTSDYHRRGYYLFDFIDSLDSSKNYLIRGYWQFASLANSIEPILRKDLRFVETPSAESNRILERIRRADNPVAIHIRANWYHDSKENSHVILHAQRNLNLSYYQKAIEHIRQKVGSARFFVFADDIELGAASLARLDLGDQVTYVDSSVRPEWEDLYLMRHCKHFVLSNSSFSWWGCWLAPAKKGICIMPDNWMGYNQGALISSGLEMNEDVIRL